MTVPVIAGPRRIEIYGRELAGSLFGQMLFPRAPEKARKYAARVMVTGVMPEALSAGYEWERNEQIALLKAYDPDSPTSQEIESALRRGQLSGLVTRTLWGLIYRDFDRASWRTALLTTENELILAGQSVGISTLKAHLAEFADVLHLWGALCIRGRWKPQPEVGYTGSDDAAAFVSEAMEFRAGLLGWAALTASTGQKHLSESMLAPWSDWRPFLPQPGWPPTGRIAYPVLSEENIPVRRKPGRPRKTSPADR